MPLKLKLVLNANNVTLLVDITRPCRYVPNEIGLPRQYPVGFGVGLAQAMTTWKPQPKLRQKKEVDSSMTDLELFSAMELGDVWEDCNLIEVYRYARRYKPETVPPSWQNAMEKLDAQLNELYPCST